MRSCCAVYVDTGYLLASAATRVTGTSLRSGVAVDHASLVQAIIGQAEGDSGLPVLRVNWYDSGAQPGGAPDRVQESIGLLPRVKLRLGRLSAFGEQKGVDLRLGLDLVTHARNRSIDLIYLVSGDDDLTEAVEEAQGHGVEVVLMAAPNADGEPHAISRHLLREADRLLILDPAAIDGAVTHRPTAPENETQAARLPKQPTPRPSPADLARPRGSAPRPVPAAPAPDGAGQGSVVYTSRTGGPSFADFPAATDEPLEGVVDDVCRSVLETWSANASPQARQDLLGSRPFIPGDIDRALLIDLSARLRNYDIDEPTRFMLRRRFWTHVDGILAS